MQVSGAGFPRQVHGKCEALGGEATRQEQRDRRKDVR